jgi:hypothetical protein
VSPNGHISKYNMAWFEKDDLTEGKVSIPGLYMYTHAVQLKSCFDLLFHL